VIFCVSTDLDLLFDEGLIDENLYIMMGTVEVRVPPLRECSADIGEMAQQIVADIAREKAWPQIPRLEKAARDFLRVQNWPGNYDELRGSLQKVMQVDAGEVLTLKIVKAALQGDTGATPRARLESHLSNQLVDTLRAAAILFGGDRAQVAALFGADVDAVASKLQ